jgi:large subunit ribosomal protein L10
MRLETKKTITEDLVTRLGEAGTVYLTDFTGLSVEAMGELRGKLREHGAEFRVVKNTLTIRALEGLDWPDVTEYLSGPTGLVLATDDPVMPAKVVKAFAKEHDDRPVVKIGIVDRVEVTADAVGRLADLPPREVLLGAIAGSMTAPVAGVVGILNALMRDIAYMTEEVARKGEAA